MNVKDRRGNDWIIEITRIDVSDDLAIPYVTIKGDLIPHDDDWENPFTCDLAKRRIRELDVGPSFRIELPYDIGGMGEINKKQISVYEQAAIEDARDFVESSHFGRWAQSALFFILFSPATLK